MSSASPAKVTSRTLTKPLILTGDTGSTRKRRAKHVAVDRMSAAAAPAAALPTEIATGRSTGRSATACTLVLALARKAVGADVAERGLHRIGLARAASPVLALPPALALALALRPATAAPLRGGALASAHAALGLGGRAVRQRIR